VSTQTIFSASPYQQWTQFHAISVGLHHKQFAAYRSTLIFLTELANT